MKYDRMVHVLDIKDIVTCPIGQRDVPTSVCDKCDFHYTTDKEENVVCCTYGVL